MPAGLGGTIMASVPLLTVMFAAAHRLERLRLRGVLGAVVALTGIAIMSSGALAGDVSLVSVLAVVVVACGPHGAADAGRARAAGLAARTARLDGPWRTATHLAMTG